MNKVKKIISMLLLICMVMTLLPMTVLAAPTADHPRDGDSFVMEFNGVGADSGTTYVISAEKDGTGLETGHDLKGMEKSKADSALYTFQFEAVSGSAGVYHIRIVYNNTTYYLDGDGDPKLTTDKGKAATWKLVQVGDADKYNIVRSDKDDDNYLCAELECGEYELEREDKSDLYGDKKDHDKTPIEIGAPAAVTVTL